MQQVRRYTFGHARLVLGRKPPLPLLFGPTFRLPELILQDTHEIPQSRFLAVHGAVRTGVHLRGVVR